MQQKRVYRGYGAVIFALLVTLILTGWLTTPAFAAGQINFSLCINDNGAGSKHDGTIDLCDWSNGAINTVNSDYAESDGVPPAFGIAMATPVPIASDTFDSVSGAEHPPFPERAMLVGCKSLSGLADGCTNFSYSISHIPSTTCYHNCGTSTAQVTVGFDTVSGGDHLITIYFSGELSAASFWGAGFGASSAPGASFHMRLTEVDGGSVGNQDNQIQVPKEAHNADLAITKTAPETIVAGNELTYVINVTNSGPDAATAVVVDDTLPLSSNVTYVSSSPSQGSCSLSSNDLSCDIGLLNPGGTATITVVLDVDSATADGTQLINTATVTGNITDPTPGDNTAQTTTTVTAPPPPQVDLSVEKTDNPDPVTAGDNLTYTVTVTNNSTVNSATGVTLTDSLPPRTTYISATPSQGSCSETGGIVTCNLGGLATGASATVTIVVNVKASTPAGTISNTATVTGDQQDPNLTNNSTTEETTVVSNPDLSITKSDNPDPITSGDQLTYTLHVANSGPSDAFGVTVTDTLPSEAAFISASTGCSAVGQVVTCTISQLPVGGSQDFNIVVLVTSASPTIITNTATVTGNFTDPTPGDNTATADTTVNVPEVPADVSIVKTAPGTVAMGSSFNYSLTVTNNGPGTATHVTVTDVLPNEVSFVSAAPQSGTCAVANDVLTCELGDMSNGASLNITVTVQADPAFFGTITNTGVVAAGGDDNPNNNQSTVNTTVPSPPPPPPPSSPLAVPTISE
ncbi:MAG: DUF11 domain-containing protein [Candidatus Sulfobium sp.]